MNSRSWSLVFVCLSSYLAPVAGFPQVCSFSNSEDLIQTPAIAPVFPIAGLELDFTSGTATTPYRVSTLINCSNSEFDCFVSEPLEFSIPKKQPRVGDVWSFRALSYRREKDVSVRRFGETVSFAVISQSNGKWKSYFLFSRAHNLAGFLFADNGGVPSREAWLQEEKCAPFQGREWNE